MTTPSLGPLVQSFFLEHLITLKGLRPASVRSYRDAIRLFLLFVAADNEGKSPAQVAINWLLQRPGVTAPIIGARRMDQLDAAHFLFGVNVDRHAPTVIGNLQRAILEESHIDALGVSG